MWFGILTKTSLSLHLLTHNTGPVVRHQTLEFEVQDTGIGISHADLLRLFSPFVQSDASTTRTHGGMGVMVVLAVG